MPNIPLAERLRPRTIDEYIGQEHLVGKNGVFRKFFETGNVPSFILWGLRAWAKPRWPRSSPRSWNARSSPSRPSRRA